MNSFMDNLTNTFMPVDFVFAGLILILTVRCAIRGFISEIMSMAAFLLGLLASLFFFRKGGEFLRTRYMPDYKMLADIAAFILLFLIVFFLVKILARILKDIIEGVHLGKADRFLGLLFGFIEGVIIVSAAIFIISVQPLFDPQTVLHDSFFAGIILPLIIRADEAAANTAIILRSLKAGAYV